MNSLEPDMKIQSQMADSQLKSQSLSQHLSQNLNDKSPLSRGINSPQSYFSSISYQKFSHIQPALQIESKLIDQQSLSKLVQHPRQNRYLARQKELQINQNTAYTQVNMQSKSIKDPMKELALLKSKIKEEQFLIELQNAVHTQLMNMLSKKDKYFSLFKKHKLDPNTCYQIQEQTQSFLDKVQSYAKNIKKISQMAPKHRQ